MKKTYKPKITLIISSSVDGCLIGRDSDELDSNKNWKNSEIIKGVIQQFFDFSPNSLDVYNLINAATVLRIGIDNDTFVPKKEDLRLVVFDEDNEVTQKGIKNLALSVEKLIVVTTKKVKKPSNPFPDNCFFIHYKKKVNLTHLAETLKKKYKVKKLTIQSTGVLNSRWIDTGLVDFLTTIFYPVLVSSNGTPTLFSSKLFTARPLQLITTKVFDTNYLLLRYKVIN